MHRNNFPQNALVRDTPDRALEAPELPWNAA
jgi:hypothetical protein